MRGVILAGGSGSRLWPVTKAVSKQLLPIYDKPMIYYPLSTLMLAGLKEIIVIVGPDTQSSFESLLGDGSQWGIKLEYAVQSSPDGLAHGLLVAEEFVAEKRVALMLGDNLLYGPGVGKSLNPFSLISGASIFAVQVNNPEDYGVVEFDSSGRPLRIVEKPREFVGKHAIPGLYFYDNSVFEIARGLKRSARGEYEISDVNQEYLNRGQLQVNVLPRGTTWMDTGTLDSFADAVDFVRVLEKRQGLRIGCPEEIAWRMGYIDGDQLEKLAKQLMKSGYGEYLLGLLENGPAGQ
jgi:glucose-1-phosphate thymidylyltransferase